MMMSPTGSTQSCPCIDETNPYHGVHSGGYGGGPTLARFVALVRMRREVPAGSRHVGHRSWIRGAAWRQVVLGRAQVAWRQANLRQRRSGSARATSLPDE